MFSSLLESKYEYEQNPTSITLSYTDLTTLSPVDHKYQNVHTLTINHSQLKSLDQIQQFEELEHLSIKYNNITNIKQLFKIKNKQKIKSLDFKGNDIQHFQAARIETLKEHFPNLIQLNGVDYRFNQISKINLRKEVQTVRILHRLDTLGCILESINKPKQATLTDRSYTKPILGERNENSDPCTITQKKKQLHISMGSAQNVNQHICQPTATFARQKQIQQKSTFGFKKDMGLSRIQRKSEHSIDASMMRYISNNNNNTSNQSGIFPDLNEKVNQNKEDLGEAYYIKHSLLGKFFFRWSQFVNSNKYQVKEDRPFKKQWPTAINH